VFGKIRQLLHDGMLLIVDLVFIWVTGAQRHMESEKYTPPKQTNTHIHASQNVCTQKQNAILLASTKTPSSFLRRHLGGPDYEVELFRADQQPLPLHHHRVEAEQVVPRPGGLGGQMDLFRGSQSTPGGDYQDSENFRDQTG